MVLDVTVDEPVAVADLAGAEADVVTGLLVAVVLDGDEVEEHAVDGIGDALDCLLEDDARVAEAVDEGESDVVVGLVVGGLLGHVHGDAVVVVEDVLHGGEEPGADVLDPVEGGVEREKDLLGEVLGDLAVADFGVEGAADHGIVVAVDAGEENVLFLEQRHGYPLSRRR